MRADLVQKLACLGNGSVTILGLFNRRDRMRAAQRANTGSAQPGPTCASLVDGARDGWKAEPTTARSAPAAGRAGLVPQATDAAKPADTST